jgi:hypothetical protein
VTRQARHQEPGGRLRSAIEVSAAAYRRGKMPPLVYGLLAGVHHMDVSTSERIRPMVGIGGTHGRGCQSGRVGKSLVPLS